MPASGTLCNWQIPVRSLDTHVRPGCQPAGSLRTARLPTRSLQVALPTRRESKDGKDLKELMDIC